MLHSGTNKELINKRHAKTKTDSQMKPLKKKSCQYFIEVTLNYLLFECFWLGTMQDTSSLPGIESVRPIVEAQSYKPEPSKKSQTSSYF